MRLPLQKCWCGNLASAYDAKRAFDDNDEEQRRQRHLGGPGRQLNASYFAGH